MLTPPCSPSLPMFADENSKADTGPPVAIITALAQIQHSVANHVQEQLRPGPVVGRSNLAQQPSNCHRDGACSSRFDNRNN
jgi:hypothetical protein